MNEILVGVISAAIALAAAAVTIYYSKKTHKVSALTIRMQYFSELREWARDVGVVLSESVHLCEINPDNMPRKSFHEMQHDVKVRLSALIDQGRWFFPNLTSESHGAEKEKAFQGYRHTVLDVLVFTYKLVKRMEAGTCLANDKIKEEMVSHKRVFISEIQTTLDPRALSKEFSDIAGFNVKA